MTALPASRPITSVLKTTVLNNTTVPSRNASVRLRITRRGRIVLASLVSLPLIAGLVAFAILGFGGASSATASGDAGSASFEYVTVQAGVLSLLRELQQERDMGMILVTHDLGVVADICDRVAVLRSGRIVETKPVAELFAAPEHPYTRELLASTLDDAPTRAERARTGTAS